MVGAENILNLMGNKASDIVSRNRKVGSGVKYFGLSSHSLSDTCCECKADIAVDIDLADCHGSGLAKHILRNALCVAEVAAVLIDYLYILGNNA